MMLRGSYEDTASVEFRLNGEAASAEFLAAARMEM